MGDITEDVVLAHQQQRQQQQQEQPDNDGEFCFGVVLPIIIVPGKLVVKLSTVIRGDT